ncbi:hypothetical protein ACQPZP_09315 [Spirillospora sp. CA-142024]|uniref:hypothetical protein n=1 Tax=Spirillospora sp. CA-142024 TaxID=3240036 RepID=UPI003D8F14F9
MSEEDDRVRGPAMLAATNMLKPPPAVIGSLNKSVTLPRTVRLTTLIAVVIGSSLGFLIAFMVLGPGLNALMYGPVLGGAAGWSAVNFSPLRGESLAKWLGLQVNGTRNRKLVVDGRQVRLYVGIAPLRRTAAGTVRMLPGGVPVDAVSWDSRGYPQQKMPGADRLRPRGRGGRGLKASTQLSSGRRRPKRRR